MKAMRRPERGGEGDGMGWGGEGMGLTDIVSELKF